MQVRYEQFLIEISTLTSTQREAFLRSLLFNLSMYARVLTSEANEQGRRQLTGVVDLIHRVVSRLGLEPEDYSDTDFFRNLRSDAVAFGVESYVDTFLIKSLSEITQQIINRFAAKICLKHNI